MRHNKPLSGLAVSGEDASEPRGQVVEVVHADGVVPPEDRLHARELRLVAQEQAEDDGPFGAAQAVDGSLDRLRAFVLSGSRAMLPPTRPLRTVHEPFDSHGSSLSVAPYGTRFLNVQASAVDLPVAGGVEEHTVLVLV